MNESEIEALRSEWCAEFMVDDTVNGLIIRTPFLFPDGDSMTIAVERRGERWAITDKGATVSRLFFDQVDLTTGRQRWITDIALRNGLELSDTLAISLITESAPPSALDIADFIRVVSHVSAVAYNVREAGQQYPNKIVSTLEELFPERVQRRWSHPADTKGLYTPDARLLTPTGGVMLFAVSSSDKASRTALAGTKLDEWHAEEGVLVPYDPKLHRKDQDRLRENLPAAVFREVELEANEDDLRELVAEFGLH